MFANDTAFMVSNYQDAQEIITHSLKSAKAFGLKIKPKKTKVMYQAPHDICQDIQIEG